MRIDPNCKACGGAGANSNGRICYPCQKNGKLVEVDPKLVSDSAPKLKSWSPEAEAQLRELWDVPEGVDEALFNAATAQDPIVAESHLAEARDLLTADDDPALDGF